MEPAGYASGAVPPVAVAVPLAAAASTSSTSGGAGPSSSSSAAAAQQRGSASGSRSSGPSSDAAHKDSDWNRDRDRKQDRDRDGGRGDRDRDREAREGRDSGGAYGKEGGGKGDRDDGKKEYKGPVELPNFGLTGALAEDAATGNVATGAGGATVQLKWAPPPEARPPPRGWRLFFFKGEAEAAPPLPLRTSALLFGRDLAIADVKLEHPSCSKQHAVLQFRQIVLPPEPGDMTSPPQMVVKPYIMDLEATNGTFLNGAAVPAARYVELRAGDVLRFGHSNREYVLMHEGASSSSSTSGGAGGK